MTSAPLMGHRCRFTVSTEWQSTRDPLVLPGGYTEAYDFIPKPSPVREWIAVHLLHQPPLTENNIHMRPSIRLETYAGKHRNRMIKIVSGYPEPDWLVIGKERVRGEEHVLIDGCPATIRRTETTLAGMTLRGTMLLVCTPDHSAGFTVYGMAERQYSDQADREMQAIISSFHVDNVGGGNGVHP